MKWREDVRQTDLGENESLKKKEQEEGHKREREGIIYCFKWVKRYCVNGENEREKGVGEKESERKREAL